MFSISHHLTKLNGKNQTHVKKFKLSANCPLARSSSLLLPSKPCGLTMRTHCVALTGQRRWDILGAPQGDENCHWEMSGLQVQLLAEVGENQEEAPAPVKAGRTQSMSRSKTFKGTMPLALLRISNSLFPCRYCVLFSNIHRSLLM